MGIPSGFRWLSQKYPKIISGVIEEQPSNIDGHEIPVDTTKPNPNGEEFDNLYLDMNNIVHPCSHPEDRPPPATEEDMMLAVFEYTDRIVRMVRPRKLLMLAVDGVAPRAKMNQQRSRRFRSAREAKEKDEDNEEFLKMLQSQNGGVTHEAAENMAQKKTWDSNAITPGTPFMNTLALCLRYWCAYKINTDSAWEKVKVIISDATVPGEGEHKIMEFIRSQRASLEFNPNTRHVIYGLDADLIMLCLATHEPHFRVLREDVFFQESKGRTCRICGQKGHIADECRGEAKQKDGEFDEKDRGAEIKPYIWLHVSILREYLEAELYVPQQPFRFDLERAIDDWVFMCFFVGNDFLPHLPSLDIKENGIDTLIAIWRDNIPLMGGYLTKDGHVDFERAQFILDGLAKQEDAIFRRRRQTEEKRDANAKRRKLEEENRAGSRKPSGRQSLDNGPNGRRKSPDYSPMSQQTGSNRPKPNDMSQPPPELPLFVPGKGSITKEDRAVTHEMVVNRGAIFKANLANKSAAAALKSQMLSIDQTSLSRSSNDAGSEEKTNHIEISESPQSALGKRKAELMEDGGSITPGQATPTDGNGTQVGPDDPPPDTVRLWEEGYADRYYEQKFGVDPKDIAFRNKVAKAYVEGLAWVLLYYFQGCPSWTWYYPYHYAPFAADFVDLHEVTVKFEKGIPFKPYEQLMGVLPAASNHAIPEVFRGLMSDVDSEILDFYPEDFSIDLNGKKFAWQGVALLPFIDSQRLLKAMATKYPLLSIEDAARNEVGRDVLIVSDRHPLYDEIATKFYSKRQESPKYKLNPRISDGLAGKVEKDDVYIPQSSLQYPFDAGGMPNLDEDHSISVHYELPHSHHIHKSMLLRGVKFPPPALDRTEIEAAKGRANRTGRSYGGVPFQGGNGRGRSQISYADPRPNPFAAHVDPNLIPPFADGGFRGPPPPHMHGWNLPFPPGSDFPRRGPPPPPSYGYGPPPPTQDYGRGPPERYPSSARPQYKHADFNSAPHYSYSDQKYGNGR